MKSVPVPLRGFLLPLLTFGIVIGFWWLAAARGWLVRVTGESTHIDLFPSPTQTIAVFRELATSGTLLSDILASVGRLLIAYTLSGAIGVTLGLWVGQQRLAREALLPLLNFLRALSPLAWIPFVVLWIGVGDGPVIVLIVVTTFSSTAVATAAAVGSVPSVTFKVAKDYGIRGLHLLSGVTFPAIAPQIITILRVTLGVAWLVLIAAETVAGERGLGFRLQDANNGLRADMIFAMMLTIGALSAMFDRLLMLLTKIPSVRWGYDR